MTRSILTICLIAASFSPCLKHETVAKPPTAVRTVAVELAPAPTSIRYSGIVAPDTQVDLAFRVSGYVEQIGRGPNGELQEGDYIGAGAMLARLRPTEYQTKVS